MGFRNKLPIRGRKLHKCIRFCYELKAGDIAVIVDNNRVAFAYIGEYYEEQSPTLTVELEKEVHQQIEKANPNTDTFTCPYIKAIPHRKRCPKPPSVI